ncbi:MAG: hypothetical protein ABWY81_07510 [Jiangellaceae bacterium]
MREDSDQMEPTFSEAERDTRRADNGVDLDPEIVSDRNDDGSADAIADRDVDDVDDVDMDRAEAAVDDAPVTVDDNTTVAGEPATSEAADQRDELLPGEMGTAPVGDLWAADSADDLHTRWQELQLRFVDDPRGVVIEARSLVAEAVQSLTAALSDRQRDLDGLTSSNGDTEQLRTALQRYRDFFDRVVGYGR